jgi:hypothetical protein
MTGIEMAAVQYRGVGVALPDLMTGRLDVIFLPVATVVGHISEGKLRPLGVTSSTRVGVLPDAFRARMHAAIATGLESAPTGVITTPGTKRPKYVSDLTARYHRLRNER